MAFLERIKDVQCVRWDELVYVSLNVYFGVYGVGRAGTPWERDDGGCGAGWGKGV
jgi:hypothetical protein